MTADIHATWPTKLEIAERLGVNVKTIDRAIARGEVEQAYRRIAGRRPLPVLNPDDVAKLEAATIQPKPFVMAPDIGAGEPSTALVAAGRTSAVMPALVELLQMQNAARPAHQALFLTLKEAADYSGLPVATLKLFMAEGNLKGIATGRGWRIRRRDLDAL